MKYLKYLENIDYLSTVCKDLLFNIAEYFSGQICFVQVNWNIGTSKITI